MTPILVLFGGVAEAFVGAFVAPAGIAVDHQHAAAVVFRSDATHGTLTLSSEVSGGAQRFAWVIPVVGSVRPTPELAEAGDLAELDAWTAPQIIEVTCQDLFPFFDGGNRGDTAEELPATGPRSRGKGPWGCGGHSRRQPYYDYYGYYGRPDTAGQPYEQEATPVVGTLTAPEFVAANWTFSVVDGSQLLGALDVAGLVASDALEADLGSYLNGDRWFVIAEANLDAPADGRWLEPFRFDFESALSPLLVRAGASTSSGQQDLVIYTFQDDSVKGVSVNYEALAPETQCLVDSVEVFPGFYEAELAEAFSQLPEDAGGAGWIREYESFEAINEAGERLDSAVLERIAGAGRLSGFVLTRSRVRYDPVTLEKDPALSTGPDIGAGHLRYVLHDDTLEANFPTCNVPFPVDPGSCADVATERRADPERGTMAGVGVLVAAAALWRGFRRR